MRRLKSSHLFLKQVYKHSKTIFLLLIMFIAGQLFFNYKIGVVSSPGITSSPFFLYGMYSNVYKVENSYSIFEIIVDGKMLQGKDFSPQEWDRIILPLTYFCNIKTSNKLYETDIKGALAKVNIETSDLLYIQKCDYSQFINWYSIYLQSVLKKRIDNIEIRQRNYLYKEGQLQPTNSVSTLAAACN